MAANNNTDAHKLLKKLQKQLEVGNVPLGAVGEKKYLGDVRVGSLKLAAKRQQANRQQAEKKGNSASAVEDNHSAVKTHGKIHIKGGRRRKTKRKRKHKRKHKKKTRSHKGGRKRKTKRRKTKRRKTKRRRRR